MPFFTSLLIRNRCFYFHYSTELSFIILASSLASSVLVWDEALGGGTMFNLYPPIIFYQVDPSCGYYELLMTGYWNWYLLSKSYFFPWVIEKPFEGIPFVFVLWVPCIISHLTLTYYNVKLYWPHPILPFKLGGWVGYNFLDSDDLNMKINDSFPLWYPNPLLTIGWEGGKICPSYRQWTRLFYVWTDQQLQLCCCTG